MTSNIIKMIIELIQSDDWFGISENMEIAKGKYKLPKNFIEKNKLKRRKLLFTQNEN